MKNLLLFAIVITSFNLFAQQTNETLQVGTTTRTYVQYLPTGFDSATESLPVVFCLHGIGDVATNMANIGFNQMADTARFIAVYPQGMQNAFSQNSWNNGAFLSSTADDISFFNQMIDSMILSYNADPTRIYVSGFSMGAIMTYHLACNLNARVAAIASMSGAMSSNDYNSCAPSYVTPLIHFHGTVDATVPYDASPLPSLELATTSIDFWRNAHTCLTTADSTQLTDSAADGYTVDRFIYQNCTPLSSVEHWRINGGDHEYFYEPNNDFTEAVEIWLFFRQWSHSNPASAGLTEMERNTFEIQSNPVQNKLKIKSIKDQKVEIWSVMGEKINELKLNSGENVFNMEGYRSGMYFIRTKTSSQRLIKL